MQRQRVTKRFACSSHVKQVQHQTWPSPRMRATNHRHLSIPKPRKNKLHRREFLPRRQRQQIRNFGSSKKTNTFRTKQRAHNAIRQVAHNLQYKTALNPDSFLFSKLFQLVRRSLQLSSCANFAI